ncbi:MAG: hypothetical protein JXB39_13765 [Deltaproteobacteria bacterium]|nr:hypothetical protein [Deltaproteobacteria bacterium]
MWKRDEVVTPDDWLPHGEAVARANREKPLAIWQGIPGERSRIHVFRRGTHQDLGRWERSVDTPHPCRVDPPCDRYSTCGGCPIMHLDAGGQARVRRYLIRRALEAVDLQAWEPAPMVASPDGDQAFRHHIALVAGRSDRDRIRLGVVGRNGRDVIPIPGCLVVTPGLKQAMKGFAHHVIALDVRPWSPSRRDGLLRSVILRQSRATGEILATLVAAHRAPVLGALAEAVAMELADLAGVHLHLDDDPGSTALDGASEGLTRHLLGRDTTEEQVAGLRLLVGPLDAFAPNPSLADRLVRDVEALLPPDRPVLDLDCGLGGITLVAARRTGWALGVEEHEHAILHARAAASLNGLQAEFMGGRVGEAVPGVARRLGGTAPSVVVHLGRRGLDPGVEEAIRALEPGRLLFVSSSLTALSRNLASFVASGFRPVSLVPYDMLPHRAHVEVVAVLDGPVTGIPRPAPRRRRVGAPP